MRMCRKRKKQVRIYLLVNNIDCSFNLLLFFFYTSIVLIIHNHSDLIKNITYNKKNENNKRDKAFL